MLGSAVVEGDPLAAAEAAALDHGTDATAGISRIRRGKSFGYKDARGRAVRDAATLRRIRALAIPPAWTDVWIDVRSLRAIEAVVARYVDPRARRHA